MIIFFFFRFRGEDIWLAAGGGCHSLSLCSSHKHSTVLADDYRCNTAPLWIMFRLECRQRSLSRTLMSGFFWSHQYFLWFYNLLHSRKIIDSDRCFIDAPDIFDLYTYLLWPRTEKNNTKVCHIKKFAHTKYHVKELAAGRRPSLWKVRPPLSSTLLCSLCDGLEVWALGRLVNFLPNMMGRKNAWKQTYNCC